MSKTVKTFYTDKDIFARDVALIPSFKLSKAELRNIEDTIKFLVEDIDYHTPTDRCLVIDMEINIQSSYKTFIIYNITPCFRGKLKMGKVTNNAQELLRTLTVVAQYKLSDLTERGDLQKQLKWALDYYGLTIMYARHHSQIKVDIQSKSDIKVTNI